MQVQLWSSLEILKLQQQKVYFNKSKTQNQQKKLSPKTTKTLKIAKQFSLKITKTNRFHPDMITPHKLNTHRQLFTCCWFNIPQQFWQIIIWQNFRNSECLHFLLIVLSSWRHSTHVISFMWTYNVSYSHMTNITSRAWQVGWQL